MESVLEYDIRRAASSVSIKERLGIEGFKN